VKANNNSIGAALLPDENGQLAGLATHGATIRSVLIGADAGRCSLPGLGELTCATETAISVQRESFGKAPLDLFVVSWDEPSDAMAEYIRLTGHPVMPPSGPG